MEYQKAIKMGKVFIAVGDVITVEFTVGTSWDSETYKATGRLDYIGTDFLKLDHSELYKSAITNIDFVNIDTVNKIQEG